MSVVVAAGSGEAGLAHSNAVGGIPAQAAVAVADAPRSGRSDGRSSMPHSRPDRRHGGRYRQEPKENTQKVWLE